MMDKNLLIFIAVGLVFMYFVTNFVNELQQEDEQLQSTGYQKKHSIDQFMKQDSIGQDILDVEGESAEVQVAAWNQSKLKHALIGYFPDFDTMKLFAKERVRGEILRNRLHQHIDSVEKRFFSGEIDAEKAKKELETLN